VTRRFPAIDELIPHRGLMALLVEVTARLGPDGLVCRGRIAAGHPLARAEGGASALLAIELGAQSRRAVNSRLANGVPSHIGLTVASSPAAASRWSHPSALR